MELKDPAIESQEFFEFTISCSREVLSIVFAYVMVSIALLNPERNPQFNSR